MFIIESKSGEVIGEAVVIEEGLALMSSNPKAARLLRINDEGPPTLMAYKQGSWQAGRPKKYFSFAHMS